jgi:uncharacterized membrane protein HdeD (DUF308 family)
MVIESMVAQASRNWGWIVLRGMAAILFGVLAIVWPGITLTALVLVWGFYALLDGVLALITAFRFRIGGKPMWPLAVIGLAGIAAGIVTFVWPQITALGLLAVIATWAIFVGVFELAAAIRFRKLIANEWMMGLAGLLSIAFGVIVALRPASGALAVVWIIAGFAILLGLTLTMLGFRVKSLAGMVPRTA